MDHREPLPLILSGLVIAHLEKDMTILLLLAILNKIMLRRKKIKSKIH